MNYLDCTAGIGPWSVPPPAGPLDAAGLRRELAEHGIGGALVHHGLARDYDPAAGNAALLRELAGAGEAPDGVALTPCATLLPHHGRESPPPREHVPSLLACGVRGVRLYPRHVLSHAFPSPAALSALAAEYPRATMALGHASADPRTLPGYYAVCAARPNVYLDLCYSVQWRGLLEQMAAAVGAERILYSSDIPFVDPRPQLGRVAFTRLPDAALRAILGDNAERLWEKVCAC